MPDAMDRKDTDMTEREDVAAVPQQHPNDGGARELLTLARQLINQGKPSQALQAVIKKKRRQYSSPILFNCYYYFVSFQVSIFLISSSLF